MRSIACSRALPGASSFQRSAHSSFYLLMLAPRLGSDWDFGGRGIISGVLTIYMHAHYVYPVASLSVCCVLSAL